MKTWFLALTLCCSAFAWADPVTEEPARPFFEGKGEGWFWYQDPKDKPPRKPVEPPVPAPVAPVVLTKPVLQPFSVEWLRTHIPVLLDKAIDEPTRENVEAYLYAQRIVMDKAQRYSEAAQKVVLSDPILDENNRVPIASFAKAAFGARKSGAEKEAVKYLTTLGGLWFFFDSKCAWCKAHAATMMAMREQQGFIVKAISLDGQPIKEVADWVPDSGQAARLGVKIVPTTVFVIPPDNFYVLSQGMMAQTDLLDRLLIAAEDRNLLPPELAKAIKPENRGVLTAEDIADGAEADTAVWVAKLKARLAPRY